MSVLNNIDFDPSSNPTSLFVNETGYLRKLETESLNRESAAFIADTFINPNPDYLRSYIFKRNREIAKIRVKAVRDKERKELRYSTLTGKEFNESIVAKIRESKFNDFDRIVSHGRQHLEKLVKIKIELRQYRENLLKQYNVLSKGVQINHPYEIVRNIALDTIVDLVDQSREGEIQNAALLLQTLPPEVINTIVAYQKTYKKKTESTLTIDFIVIIGIINLMSQMGHFISTVFDTVYITEVPPSLSTYNIRRRHKN